MHWESRHEHTFSNVAKRKGSRVRYRCDSCPMMGPWVRFVDPSDTPSADYSTMTVVQLRQQARNGGHTGFSKMNKGELVALLSRGR